MRVERASLSGVAREAASILARLYEAERQSCFRRGPEPEDFDEQNALLAFSGGSLAGYAYVWEQNGALYASIVVDAGLPQPLALEAYMALAGSLAAYTPRGSTSLVTLYAGPRHGPRYELARQAFPGLVESPGFVYMLSGLPVGEARVPEGYRVEIHDKVPEDLVPGVVEVYNRAFASYLDYSEWSVESARRYYSEFDPGELVLVAAYHGGRLVGFAEAQLYESMCGVETAHLALLAVDPSHQRRGLGTALSSIALNLLAERGASQGFLVAEASVERVYWRLGFKPVMTVPRLRASIA